MNTKTSNALYVKSALLVKVAEQLKNKEITHEWTNQESDNVGVVALALSEMTPGEFADCLVMARIDLMMALNELPDVEYAPYDLNFWEPFSRLSRICAQQLSKKDYKRPEILYKLEEVGFTDEELDNLQKLSDPQVLSHTNIKVLENNYQNKLKNLIEYLYAWSELISQTSVEVV